MTPYRSGFPTDSIPPVDPLDPDIHRRRQVYQRIVVWINWLATCPRPEISPPLTFLASDRNPPRPQHYKATVDALKYLTSTNGYVISFKAQSSSTIQAFDQFPNHHDKEAYTEAKYPSPSEFYQITAFCNDNWGGQFGSAVKDGNPLELFKFRSLSGFLICRSGGPIARKSIRKNQTSLSSCEVEIVATNECATEIHSLKHRANDIGIP